MMYLGTPRARFELTTIVMIGIDCIGNCKSNYHTITTTTKSTPSILHIISSIIFANFHVSGSTNKFIYQFISIKFGNKIFSSEKYIAIRWKLILV